MYMYICVEREGDGERRRGGEGVDAYGVCVRVFVCEIKRSCVCVCA